MALQIGIVGLPNAGKSTLFNALLGRQIAAVAERPFTTIKPNTGIVAVPDNQLKKLADLVKPEKTVPATVKFIDLAGLVKGAHQGEGLGNQFLGQIRNCDAIIHLVRAFTNAHVSRFEGSTDPASDVTIVNLEMILADFEIIARKLAEIQKKARGDPKLKKLVGALEKLKKTLGEGKFAHEAGLAEEERKMAKEFNLLTAKPIIHVLNTDEAGPAKGKSLPNSFSAIKICALLEADLASFDPEERKQYLLESAIKEAALDKLIKKAYQLLGLVTFYTIKGGKETRAWSIKKGASAFQAAAKVHTDMARGFIKAEVINVEALLKTGSWPKAKDQGQIRLEGKNYPVKDKDVIEFKFSP